MAQSWWREDRRLGTALAASLFLHVLVALLMPSLQASAVAAPGALEMISFVRIPHVSVHVSPVAARARPVVILAHAPVLSTRPQAAKAKSKGPSYSRSKSATSHQKTGASQTQPAAVADMTGAPVPSVAPAQTATPAIAARKTQEQTLTASHGNTNSSGSGLLGDAHDPTLDGSVVDDLRRRFKMDVTLVVLVGDDGKMKSIEFHPPLDAESEKAIHDLLADAHFDPAYCGGGIPCEGKATIRLSAQ